MIGIHSTNKFVSDFLTVKDVNINRCTEYSSVRFSEQESNRINVMLDDLFYYMDSCEDL